MQHFGPSHVRLVVGLVLAIHCWGLQSQEGSLGDEKIVSGILSDAFSSPVILRVQSISGDGNLIEFQVEAPPGTSFRLEGSEDLTDWKSIFLERRFQDGDRFTDQTGLGFKHRFYRLLEDPNLLPMVELLEPVEGSQFLEYEIIAMEALALDSNGEVVKVEFLVDGAVEGETTFFPYRALASRLAPGSHQVQARAYDNEGGFSVSRPVEIEVLPVPLSSVPNLVGLPLDEATRKLLESGHAVRVVEKQKRVLEPAITVLAQNPQEGTLLGEGFSVEITISIPDDSKEFIDVFSGQVVESDLTAIAYYAAIDPFNRKTTLEKWLSENNAEAPGDERAEAVYFNEGDLGFGRHMYMRRGAERTIYWVTNHPTVDDAWQEPDAPLATVAMEFSPPPGGGKPFVKFYTFDGNGDRILKIDLDGEGDKYQPGMCTSCHGGKPLDLVDGIYPNQGDIGTRFLPFDLETFRYSEVNRSLNRANQEAEFKKLNRGVRDHYYADGTRPSTRRSFLYRGDPLRIEGNGGQGEAGIEVQSMHGLITDLNVRIDGNSTCLPGGLYAPRTLNYLRIELISPQGFTVPLHFSGTGDRTQYICGMTWDDQAPAGFEPGDSPFRQDIILRPATPLLALNGQNPNGLWRLRLKAEGDHGGAATLFQWSLHFNSNQEFTSAAVELLEGWYGGELMSEAVFNEFFTPLEWQPPLAPASAETFYQEVVKFSCRSCHVQQTPRNRWLDFSTFAGFSALSPEIRHLICDRGSMPAAKRTFENFWQSVHPGQPRLFSEFLEQQVLLEALEPGLNFGEQLGWRNSLVVDPLDPSKLFTYMSVGDFGEEQKVIPLSSQDGGDHWQRHPELAGVVFDRLTLGRDLEQTVLYAIGREQFPSSPFLSDYAVFTSFDGGESWNKAASAGFPNSNPSSFRAGNFDSLEIYAGFQTEGLRRSRNGGNTWESFFTLATISDQRVESITDIEVDGVTIWITSSVGLLRSRNRGVDWEILFDPRAQGFSDDSSVSQFEISVESGVMYCSSRQQLFKSMDAGMSWELVPIQGLPFGYQDPIGYIQDLKVHPNDSRQLFVVTFNYYATYHSVDGGLTWDEVPGKYFFNDLTLLPRAPFSLLGVSQLGGVSRIFRGRNLYCEEVGPGRPLADGVDLRNVPLGEEVKLDGSKSLYADIFEWRIIDQPLGANATLSPIASPTPRFRTEQPGVYRIGLRVIRNGVGASEEKVFSFEAKGAEIPVSFSRDILPLFSDCSFCHTTSQNAPGNLTLAGANVDLIYSELLNEVSTAVEGNPRINLQRADQSLILLKASNTFPKVPPHAGGLRTGFEANSGTSYLLLRRWIEEGAMKN